MKKALILLVAMSSPAMAADYFYSKMKNGGALVLMMTDEGCLFGRSGFLMNQFGDVILKHCWEVVGKKVRVNYSDGDTKEYPITGFDKGSTGVKGETL